MLEVLTKSVLFWTAVTAVCGMVGLFIADAIAERWHRKWLNEIRRTDDDADH